MFKKVVISSMLIICVMLINSAFAASLTSITYDGKEHPYTAKDVTLMLNNDKFEPSKDQMPPIILNNRTLVPVREVFEYLTGKVDWDGQDRRVTISYEDKVIKLWIDKTTAEINGEKVELDVPAKIVNNKTMVPVRFISERAGLIVNWDSATYTVDVKFPKANITKIGFATIDGVNCLVATADKKITGYKYFSLKAENIGDMYLRLVLDIENCDFKFDTTNTKFDNGMLAAIRFGKQENDVNRIVLDLKNETDYVVVMSKDRLKLYFAMAKDFKIPGEEETTPTNTISGEKVTEKSLSGDKKVEAKPVSGDKKVESKPISGDKKVEVKPASGDKKVETKPVSGDKKAEVKPVSGDKKVEAKPVSGDKKEETKTSEVKKDDKKEEIIKIDKDSGEHIVVEDDIDTDLIPIKETEEVTRKLDFDATISSIKYSSTTKRVRIKYEGDIVYTDSILNNPNRIVLDFANTKLEHDGPNEIDVKNNIITGIRFSQYTDTSVRVVLDLGGRADYKIEKRTSELQIDVTESTYKNLKYKKNTSNSQITLMGTRVDDLKCTRYEDMFKYVIEFDEKEYDFGNGTISPEDNYVKSITIEDDKITIVDVGNINYSIRKSGVNVVITLRSASEEDEIVDNSSSSETINNTSSKPSSKSGKTRVLIDVGHGGSDPGACNGDAQEKDYNLNIAMYLYDLLKARDDIDLYIDRKDDIYLNREDRVEYATAINPDLIVSIHNNSVDNKSYSGTMVLYYNNDTESDYGDITSKECAEIILEQLVEYLGTVNKGVLNRGDLHILSKTPCPSVLCEVCFISNDAELEKLKTNSFQKAAATAIYNGVLEIISEM